MIADVDTAAVYGRQAGAALASIKAIDIEDPAASSAIILDQMTGIATAMGFDLADAGGAAGLAGKAIDALADAIHKWTDGKKAKSDADRDAQQEKIVNTIASRYAKRGKWIVELSEHDLEGNGGYYHKVSAVGLAGILKKELVPALPLRAGFGCYQQGSGGGKAPQGWRFWPALFPVIYNTQQLTLQVTTIQSSDALDRMLEMGARAFDPVGNLLIDGRDVAETLSNLKEWSRPLFKDDAATGTPITPVGPNMRLPEPDDGRRFVYENANGTLLIHEQKDRTKPSAPDYQPHVRWLQTPRGVISMEAAAYNHVLQTCARFFAYRETLLARAPTWNRDASGAAIRDAAALSSEPSVKAALTRKPARVGRQPVGRPGKPTTTGVNGPTAQHKKPPRVGRLDPWPTIAAIENLIAETT